MASISDMDGHFITQGLQGSSVCDEAINAAVRIAAEKGEDVLLIDEDEYWFVSPDGEAQRIVCDCGVCNECVRDAPWPFA